YKTTKWIVATFCLAVLVFGCKVENVIQNNLTIDGFIFYATLVKEFKKYLGVSAENKQSGTSVKGTRQTFSGDVNCK
ncbi:hypothetical protein M4D57_26475, partial [Brevibacillus borstelensis]|nr:hypothetical protein [Brevibacillus borstelensis]